MVAKSPRQFNAVDLVSEFSRITGGYVNKGRDSHLFRELLDQTGIASTQVILGIHNFWADHPSVAKDVPTFVRRLDDWLVEDELEAAVELILIYRPQHTPGYYLTYLDARESQSRDLDQNRLRLEGWVNDELLKVSKRRK